jgi:uncharacterized protein YcbK (DUF882 family)|uniref:Uncharacterized protein n=1 Tax=viral metagenome TaxID=1070528 RepID=A0A6C0DM48_9ZZZZ
MYLSYSIDFQREILSQMKEQPSVKEKIYDELKKSLDEEYNKRIISKAEYDNNIQFITENLKQIDHIVKDWLTADKTSSYVLISIINKKYTINIIRV